MGDYCVYKISNTVDSRLYIGASSHGLEYRWVEHQREAKRGPSSPLYKAMREYGIEAFSIDLVEKCLNEEDMYRRELYFIQYFRTIFPYGYNRRGRMLTDVQAAIIKFNVFGLSPKAYAEIFGMSHNTIRQMQGNSRNNAYEHITEEHLYDLIGTSSQF